MKVINTYFVHSKSLLGGGIRKIFELENGDYIMEINPMYFTFYEKITKEDFEKMKSNF